MKHILSLILLLIATSFCADQARFNADMGNTGWFQDSILKPPLKLKWRYFTEGGFKNAPVAFKGRVFCSDRWGRVYAIEGETGRLLWKKDFYIGNYGTTIPLAYGDFLYYYATNSPLYCIRQDNGREVWKSPNIGSTTMGSHARYSPVTWNNRVYVATESPANTFRVACFDAVNGVNYWNKTYPESYGIGLGEVLVCTLTTPASIIGFYNAGSLNWCPRSGRTFVLTADSGRVVWEDSVYFTQRATVFDTLVYVSACSSGRYAEGALDVRSGRVVKRGALLFDYAPAAMDGRYIYVKPYCANPIFYNLKTWAKIGGADFSPITAAYTSSETGCGGIVLANGYGYFGLGGGGRSGTANGGRGRGGLGQGIYAFEIPKDSTVKTLKVVWGFKTASNFCSTPVVADGKLYVTTNQEGAIYCFENQ